MGNDVSREFRLEVVKWLNVVRDRQKRGDVLDEEDVKNAIIDTFLGILGWNVNDPSEVKKEARIYGKFADYALKIDGETKVIIEAKAPNVSLDGSDPRGTYEKQAINYAYNQGIDWAILSNGETWRLYNAYWKRPSKLAFESRIGDFPEQIEKIILLKKDNIRENRLDEYFKGRPKRRHVDEEVTQVLLNARADLTKSVIKLNKEFSPEELREGIQRMLDRLLFMKICEDRDIRKFGQLQNLVNMVKGDPGDPTDMITLTYYLNTAFKHFRDAYDSELFDDNVVDKLKVDNATLKPIVEILYEYDFSTINVDILGRIYEDYLANVLSKLEEGGLEWITDNRERKEHGQFYTPQYIVDYIIDNVGITKDSKILDPACGSGAFLIKAYDKIKSRYLEEEKKHKQNNNNNLLAYMPKEEITEMNRRILTENLYGVDLNPEAVELTKINLWLRSIQKDTELNKLNDNIRCGNSLIDDPEVAGGRAFKWKEGSPKVLDEGGFDVVVGNPPYVNVENLDEDVRKYLMSTYETAIKRFDIYVGFIHKGIELLKNEGYLAFIIPYSFLNQSYAEKLREMVLDNCLIEEIVNLSMFKIFPDVTVRNIILILKKEGNRSLRDKNRIKVTTQKKDPKQEGKISGSIFYISQRVFHHTPEHMFRLELNEKTLPIIEKIKSNSITLGEIIVASWGARGVPISEFHLDRPVNDLCRKMVKGKDVDRYSLIYSGKWFLYDLNRLYRPSFPELFENEKLVISEVTGKTGLIATYDNEKYYTDHSLSCCILKYNLKDVDTKVLRRHKLHVAEEDTKLSKNYNLKYILGLINSKLLSFYFKTILGYALNVYPESIEQLPIFPANKSQQKPLIELADKMLSLNKELNRISDPEKVIRKYGGGIGVKLKKIVIDSNYHNLEMSSSSAKARKIEVELNEDMILLKVNGDNILKYSEGDELKRKYTKLYLENIDPEKLNENGGMIRDRFLNLKIPDYGNSEAIKKIVEEAITRRKQIEEEIRKTDNKIDQLVYELYGLTNEEIKVVEDSLK